jgi:protein TonB
MRESYLSRSDSTRRRRTGALALTLLAHVLIILVLLNLSPSLTPRVIERTLSTFQVTPPPPPPSLAQAITETPTPKTTGGSQARAKNPVPKAPAPPAAQAPVALTGLLPGGMELFDAADIGKLPQHPEDRETGGAGEGAGKGKNSASVYGPGEGPGGERLYDVDWVKRPTDAELSPFLPATVPPGSWAIIACRMVENYRVENCRSLGESPPGSGLSRGLRLASWQFRVFPPRVGSKKIIGGWVRIRMDFTRSAAR